MSIGKLVAYVIYYGFARWLPASYRPYALFAKQLRAACARHLLESCGAKVNVEHGADLGSGRAIRLGDRSGIGVGARVTGPVHIGANVMMGPGVTLIGRNHGFSNTDTPMIEQGYSADEPIVIEDDVWIGANVIVLPGRRVGRGSIVGAGAVVTRDCPPNSILGGNPARVIGTRGGTRGGSRESANDFNERASVKE